MADLDDFFAKKDKKKSKGKKFTTTEEIAKKLEEKKSEKPKKEKATFQSAVQNSENNGTKTEVEEEEWKEFEEEKKDYSGLKIQNLNLDDESKSDNGDGEAEGGEMEENEQGEMVRKKKGPWKAISDGELNGVITPQLPGKSLREMDGPCKRLTKHYDPSSYRPPHKLLSDTKFPMHLKNNVWSGSKRRFGPLYTNRLKPFQFVAEKKTPVRVWSHLPIRKPIWLLSEKKESEQALSENRKPFQLVTKKKPPDQDPWQNFSVGDAYGESIPQFPVAAPAVKPAAPSSAGKVYTAPHLRNLGLPHPARTPRSMASVVAPDIMNQDFFPTLSAASNETPVSWNRKKQEAAFEEVRNSKSHTNRDSRTSQRLEIGNKFGALQTENS